MEKLVIDNFLAIEHAEIEIKKINLFIGPQAQGKSLISKLIYFFKEYPQTLVEAVYRGMKTKEGCDGLVLAKFEKIFPKYTWEKHEFKITYSNTYYSVSIVNKLVTNQSKQNPYLALNLESDFIVRDVFTSLKEAKPFDPYLNGSFNIKQPLENPRIFSGKNQRIFMLVSESFSFLEGVLIDNLFRENQKPYLERVSYIPAGRSFFANIDNSIYSFIGSDIKIDFFLTRFGKIYQQTKENRKQGHNGSDDKMQKERVDNIIRNIICGDFVFDEKGDWIVNSKGKTHITNASSGQQEALPMAVVLSTDPYISQSYIAHHFIIEEPEAHLFPTSQNEIVLLIANAYNHFKEFRSIESSVINFFNSFTISTHSPYILTAFNNLIQAGNVAASKNYQDLDELRAVVPESEWVDFNDVAAYVVNNGTVKSILNQELKLIDANMIDEISEHFAYLFEKLTFMEDIDE